MCRCRGKQGEAGKDVTENGERRQHLYMERKSMFQAEEQRRGGEW